MARFALMPRESSNRVYRRAAPDLLAAELEAIAPSLAATIGAIEVDELGGVAYTCFEADALDDADRFVVSNLSTVRALFTVVGDGDLRPLLVEPIAWFDDDLISIQRYPGKTNEEFTHLLVNLAVAASGAARRRVAERRPVRLLDPVAGRGTTLNRALIYGFDASGIELAEADTDQYRTFITTYLQDHRRKHRLQRAKIRKGPLAGTSSFTVTVGGAQELHMVCGDTTRADEILAGRRFDVVVGDLPYGVQHRAGTSKHRSPGDLLDQALTGWRSLMAGGAAIGLAWNLRTLRRDAVVDRLHDAGFTVVDHPRSFEHVVDRSITRDLIVATR